MMIQSRILRVTHKITTQQPNGRIEGQIAKVNVAFWTGLEDMELCAFVSVVKACARGNGKSSGNFKSLGTGKLRPRSL